MNHECTLYRTMDYLAKRWTLLILLELRKGDQEWKRFSAIKESTKEITPKVLSERLKDLEKEGLVEKRVDATAFPVKSEYRLTEAGIELVDAVKVIKHWALKWKISNEICLLQDCRNCRL